LAITIPVSDRRFAVINCIPIDRDDTRAINIGKNQLATDMSMFDTAMLEGRRHLQILVNDCQFCNQSSHTESSNCAITNHIQMAIQLIASDEFCDSFRIKYWSVFWDTHRYDGEDNVENMRLAKAYLVNKDTQLCLHEAITHYIKKICY